MTEQLKNPLFVQNCPQDMGQLPGYGGYMQSIKAENLFGKTFGDTTRAVLQNNVLKGSNPEPAVVYKSLFTDSFQHPEGKARSTNNKAKQPFVVQQDEYHPTLSFQDLQQKAYQ